MDDDNFVEALKQFKVSVESGAEEYDIEDEKVMRNLNHAAKLADMKSQKYDKILLLRPEYFDDHKKLLPFQDIDRKYFVPCAQVLEFSILSYRWREPTNPDVDGTCFETAAAEVEPVFIDFCCLPQEVNRPRTADEEKYFQYGLSRLVDLFTSPRATFIQCLRPDDLLSNYQFLEEQIVKHPWKWRKALANQCVYLFTVKVCSTVCLVCLWILAFPPFYILSVLACLLALPLVLFCYFILLVDLMNSSGKERRDFKLKLMNFDRSNTCGLAEKLSLLEPPFEPFFSAKAPLSLQVFSLFLQCLIWVPTGPFWIFWEAFGKQYVHKFYSAARGKYFQDRVRFAGYFTRSWCMMEYVVGRVTCSLIPDDYKYEKSTRLARFHESRDCEGFIDELDWLAFHNRDFRRTSHKALKVAFLALKTICRTNCTVGGDQEVVAGLLIDFFVCYRTRLEIPKSEESNFRRAFVAAVDKYMPGDRIGLEEDYPLRLFDWPSIDFHDYTCDDGDGEPQRNAWPIDLKSSDTNATPALPATTTATPPAPPAPAPPPPAAAAATTTTTTTTTTTDNNNKSTTMASLQHGCQSESDHDVIEI